MSHDTHEQPKENKTVISFKNSFWLVVIIVGLFIAALNFVQAESGSEEGAKGEGKEKTEHKAESATENKATAEPVTEKIEPKGEAPKAGEEAKTEPAKEGK